jgi:hypothetical protein
LGDAFQARAASGSLSLGYCCAMNQALRIPIAILILGLIIFKAMLFREMLFRVMLFREMLFREMLFRFDLLLFRHIPLGRVF